MTQPPKYKSLEYRRSAWEKGFLRYKLRPNGQTWVYDSIKRFKAANPKDMGPFVVMSHRRLGKSYESDVICLERCASMPGQETRVIAPTDEDCERIHRKHIDKILQDLPPSVTVKQSGRMYVVRNSTWGNPKLYSTLTLEGSEHKKGNRQRGLASDIVVLDEFRDMEDPESLIEEVIAYHFVGRKNPLLLIVSTPPHTMSHPLAKRYIQEAQNAKAYIEIKATDNPDFTEDDKRMVLKVCRDGENGIGWRREALCELIPDPTGLIVPEFVELEHLGAYQEIVVPTYPRPEFYYPRVCVDTGYDDYNGAIFYYIDWLKQLMVIEGELWVHRQTTRSLKEMLVEKAKEVFPNPPHAVLYEGDLTKQQRADMAEMLQFVVLPVNKTEKAVSIASFRDTVRRKKLRIVGPRCPICIYQLRNATYSTSNPKDFVRNEEDDELGHCDMLAAMVYGHRQANWGARPYPLEGFNVGVGSRTVFIPTEEPDTLEVIEEEEYYLNAEQR
jgi:hypothetical protein